MTKKTRKTVPDVPTAADEEHIVDPSARNEKKKNVTTPATEAPPNVQKEEELERAGTIVRQAHASVRNRRQGG